MTKDEKIKWLNKATLSEIFKNYERAVIETNGGIEAQIKAREDIKLIHQEIENRINRR